MPTTWVTSGGGATSWVGSGTDFKDIWGDWAGVTWGVIKSSGLTWAQMAGYTFVNTSGNTTVWAITS